jgi:SRSO17 transposase
MLTLDVSDFAKKGKLSAGVARQYCGEKGKIDNCQSGVFIGYSGLLGYGLLDARLYIPELWYTEAYKVLWEQCGIPGDTVFLTKPQIAAEMIRETIQYGKFRFRWVGCDAGFGCNSEFRKSLPPNVYFFADVYNNQRVFMERPEWSLPERKGKRGKAPTKQVPSVKPVSVSDIAKDETIPWQSVSLGDGAKGPMFTEVKCLRVVEFIAGKDGDEVWLYIRKVEGGKCKYSFSNAPTDIPLSELNHAATLRWPIEQCFQECKSFLGMGHYETRSYIGWHRHMLLVMIAHLFVFKVRFYFKKNSSCADDTVSFIFDNRFFDC